MDDTIYLYNSCIINLFLTRKYKIKIFKIFSIFEINIICLDPKKREVFDVCQTLYDLLKQNGNTVLFDERELRPGIKFSENELLGIPYSIVVSPSNFNNTKYEFNDRVKNKKSELNIEEIKKVLEGN